ncbi:transposable element Tcb2 transposase [Trichonephila clavipes]|nr:transposable element Tcb2 transposase [Trichonephila clavipes]
MQEDQLLRSLNGRQRRNRLCWARKHVSWTQQQWASVLFTDESRFTMEKVVESLVWAGISLGGHTDLHVFHGGTVTGLRYRDEILDPYVRPYAAAIGNDFILMDDNARPHRARIVEEYYLEDHGLERMEWPARSPDLNPIERLLRNLGREVSALNPPPRSLHELKQGLLCVWSSLPIPVSDNLINSMEIDAANAFNVSEEIIAISAFILCLKPERSAGSSGTYTQSFMNPLQIKAIWRQIGRTWRAGHTSFIGRLFAANPLVGYSDI